MPAKRDSDGNIIEQPSQSTNAHKTDRTPAPAASSDSSYDAKTVLAGTAKRDTQKKTDKAPTGKVDEAQTRVFRPGRKSVARSQSKTQTPQPTAMDDPPVGWLVVIAGPGQGNVVTLGNGANSIGRDKSERLSLNFGDEMISRTAHASVSYDPRGKKFYIQHGGGTNLTYVNDEPVLAPQELQPNTNILMGNTTLRFVPLSGEQFDWDDLDDN